MLGSETSFTIHFELGAQETIEATLSGSPGLFTLDG